MLLVVTRSLVSAVVTHAPCGTFREEGRPARRGLDG
jgi:hypothetical protein